MNGALPREVMTAWDERDGPAVLTTISRGGVPNAIYVGAVTMAEDGRVTVTDNYFDKTRSNIEENAGAAVLFITKGRVSYQIKGDVEYHTDGPEYEAMLTWANPNHPRKGVAVLNAKEVYRGSERLA